jgi:hypothetical protein
MNKIRSFKSLIAVLALSAAVFAAPISFEKASQVAENAAKSKKLNLKHKSFKKRGAKVMYAPPPDAATAVVAEPPLFYVFQNGDDKGFVIVSGDDAFKPIIGISENGTYDPDNFPPNFAQYIENLERDMEFALENGHEQTREAREQWAAYAAGDAYVMGDYLVKTKWGQGAPYNNQTPTIDGEHAVTGCVATAIAQIINYHKWPVGTTDTIPAYTLNYTPKLLVSALPPVNFDWDNMADTYGNNSTGAQNNAVATLMNAVGRSVEMTYGDASSHSNIVGAIKALGKYFDYDYVPEEMVRNSSGDLDLEQRQFLKEQIDSGLPVLYGSSAHAYILDGYDSSGNFHANWGWSGKLDGFYDFTINTQPLKPSETTPNYARLHHAVINIKPGNKLRRAAMNGGIYILEENIDYPHLNVKNDFTLDLNGHTLTIEGTYFKDNGIKIDFGKTLTIMDSKSGGILNVTGRTSGPLFSQSSGTGINTTDATLIIESGTINAIGTKYYGAGIGGGGESDGGTVIINGGTVTATGGEYNGGAGIGGGGGDAGDDGGDGGSSGGTVIINDGIVTATGGSRGAGIGGGLGGSGGTITINGGVVTAIGSSGIGGGDNGGGNSGSGGVITINGGTVTATGRSYGAGIGGGPNASGGEITITDGTVTAISRSYGTGIGGGRCSNYTSNCSGGTITISGGTITATGEDGGAGIGGGTMKSDGGVITISGGTVTATGGKNGGAGIGGGNGKDGVGNGGNGGVITISGGTVIATGGGNYGAGIGGGYYGSGGDITISGGTVTATSGSNAAGIGGGYENGTGKTGGNVTITGGTVTAIGGTGEYSGGSGIGGGNDRGAGGNVIINGGMVTAIGGMVTTTGENGGAGIGGGRGSGSRKGAAGTLTMDGNALVFANSVDDTTAKTSGILVIGNTTNWYGEDIITLSPADYTIPSEKTLTIENGKTLKISGNATLTIPSGATIANDGTVIPEDSSAIAIIGTRTGNLIDGANTLPSVTAKTLTSITLGGTADLLANTGQEIEYAISQTDDTPADGWQTETAFDGLAEKAEYWIFARSKEDTHFKAGAMSAGLQVFTKPIPTIAELEFDIPTGHVYTGTEQGIGEVTGVAGMGAVTVYYNESPSKPINAGNYSTKASVAESTEFDAAAGIALGEYEIAAKPVAITGLSASSKTYDGNATATVTGTAAISGAIDGDDVTVINGTASFADKNVGIGKTVTFSGFSLGGTAAGNYALSAQPPNVTADIHEAVSPSSSSEEPSSSSEDPSSSSTDPSSSSAGEDSSSSEDSTPIANYAPPAIASETSTYYNIKGEPVGSAKPAKPGVYLVKQGNSVRKIVVR